MIAPNSFEQLEIFPTLVLKKAMNAIDRSSKNVSVEFKFGPDLVTAYLLLDRYNLGFEERMELLMVLSETINIFLGRMLSEQNFKLELSSPKLSNLDRVDVFSDNQTWYSFDLVYEENTYSVVLQKRGFV